MLTPLPYLFLHYHIKSMKRVKPSARHRKIFNGEYTFPYTLFSKYLKRLLLDLAASRKRTLQRSFYLLLCCQHRCTFFAQSQNLLAKLVSVVCPLPSYPSSIPYDTIPSFIESILYGRYSRHNNSTITTVSRQKKNKQPLKTSSQASKDI